MSSDMQTAPKSKWMVWLGWVITVLVALALIASGIMKLAMPSYKPEGAPDLGWDESLFFVLAIIELSCTAIYLFPPTSILGAILLTGYLGGAVATHVRIHDQFAPPIILGVLVWAGIYLRCGRLRALIPLRS